jgi:hypothetical protein
MVPDTSDTEIVYRHRENSYLHTLPPVSLSSENPESAHSRLTRMTILSAGPGYNIILLGNPYYLG